MRPIPPMIAVLFALASAGVLAQNRAQQQPEPPTGKPVSDSVSYGPVLNPQSTPAPPAPPGEARPQAQEERAGQSPATGKHNEVDPSARPAPESAPSQPAQPPQATTPPLQPKTQQELQGKPERQQHSQKQAQRRPGAVQQIGSTPRIVAPAPSLTPRAPVAATPAPVGPQTSQAVGCMGSTCTDANGATYNAGGPGNTAISSSGRLCTTNGANIQCL